MPSYDDTDWPDEIIAARLRRRARWGMIAAVLITLASVAATIWWRV